METLTFETISSLLLLGACSACFGATLGLGGSLLLIPGLTLLYGPNQHLYQAVAMGMNVGVAIMATRRHQKAGMVLPQLLKRMIPATLLGITLGTLSSNLFIGDLGEQRLRELFAVYLVYFALTPYLKRFTADQTEESHKVNERHLVWLTGLLMGMQAGLMGVGGGTVAVPLLQKLNRLSLKQAVVHSSAAMCAMCPLGALIKMSTLSQHASIGEAGLFSPLASQHLELHWKYAMIMLFPILPAALPMAHIGATLGQKLPQPVLRAALSITLLLAAVRLWW